jgi:hypothetical protein
MSSNITNQISFLRTSRSFPEDVHQLSVEVDRSYVDIANAVNSRTIGLFSSSNPSVTGNSYFFSKNQRQQSLRQIYSFGAIAAGATLNIPYSTKGLTQFATIYGSCITAVPDYRPLPYSSVTANANIELKVTATNIVITVGAASPNVTSGLIVIEWISNT